MAFYSLFESMPKSGNHAADAIAYFQHIVDVRLIAVLKFFGYRKQGFQFRKRSSRN